jgi:hypothetical protein
MRKTAKMLVHLRLVVIAALTLPCLLTAVLFATPASASDPGPHYNTNAYATGCAGGAAHYKVAATAPVTLNGTQAGYIQIWFSSTCGTNWGRVVAQPPAGVTVDPQSMGSFTVRTSDNISTNDTFPLGDGSIISGQVYAPTVTACAYGYFNTNRGFFEGEACA